MSLRDPDFTPSVGVALVPGDAYPMLLFNNVLSDTYKPHVSSYAYGTRSEFSVQVTGTRISYQKLASNSACSVLSKFPVADKPGT